MRFINKLLLSTVLVLTGFASCSKLSAAPIRNAYIPNWGVYFNNPVDKFYTQGTRLNTVTYAFMYISSNGSIRSSDSYADITKKQLEQFAYFPVRNHILSIGGGGYSGWGPALKNPKNFVASIAKYVTAYGVNGIDFDYEPSLSRSGTTANQMASLVAAVRAAYPDFIIIYTIQSGNAGATKVKGVGTAFWTKLSQNASYVQIMNYDFFGSWESKTMLGSGLNYAEPTITALNTVGIPNNKIILGIPMYATQASSVGGPGLGVTYNTRAGTPQIPYFQIIQKALTVNDVIGPNDTILGSYANDESRHFFTFDSQVAVASKSRYTLDKGLAGVMFWELTQDTLDDTSLLKAASDVLQTGDIN